MPRPRGLLPSEPIVVRSETSLWMGLLPEGLTSCKNGLDLVRKILKALQAGFQQVLVPHKPQEYPW